MVAAFALSISGRFFSCPPRTHGHAHRADAFPRRVIAPLHLREPPPHRVNAPRTPRMRPRTPRMRPRTPRMRPRTWRMRPRTS